MKRLNKLSLPMVLSASCVVACNQHRAKTVEVAHNDVKQFSEVKNQNRNAQVTSPAVTPTPELNITFGKGLRVVPKELELESQRLRYKIGVTYPQIEGTKSPQILNLNHRIKSLAVESYRWPLNPTKEDIRYYGKHPDIFNTVDLTYEVPLATDDLISIYMIGYSYGIGAAHSVQYSFTVNYDLRSGKLLKLADIFRPNINHLQFVSQYCMNELTKRHGEYVWKDALAPKAKNYQSWNITKEGIAINFDACAVVGCAGGKQEVKIPFASLKDMLNPNSPVILLAK